MREKVACWHIHVFVSLKNQIKDRRHILVAQLRWAFIYRPNCMLDWRIHIHSREFFFTDEIQCQSHTQVLLFTLVNTCTYILWQATINSKLSYNHYSHSETPHQLIHIDLFLRTIRLENYVLLPWNFHTIAITISHSPMSLINNRNFCHKIHLFGVICSYIVIVNLNLDDVSSSLIAWSNASGIDRMKN
jgi:hypothetical protein